MGIFSGDIPGLETKNLRNRGVMFVSKIHLIGAWTRTDYGNDPLFLGKKKFHDGTCGHSK